MLSIVLAAIFILFFGCAGMNDPGGYRHAFIQLLEQDKQILLRPGDTPQDNLQKGRAFIAHTTDYDLFLADRTYMPRDIQVSAIEAKGRAARYGSDYLIQAAAGFQKDGKVADARETYWEILRTFTGDAYKGVRLKAETELRYLDSKDGMKMGNSP